jgi:hypothetical protein
MRSGEALVPMSEDQLRRIFAEGNLIGWKTTLSTASMLRG